MDNSNLANTPNIPETPTPVPPTPVGPTPIIPKPDGKNGLTTVLEIVFALIFAALFAGSGYLAYQNQQLQKEIVSLKSIKPTPTSTIIPTIIPTSSPAANLQTYTNSQYKFVFSYPNDFTISSSSGDYISPYGSSTPIIISNKQGFKDTTAQYSQDANFSVSYLNNTSTCTTFSDIVLPNLSITTQNINNNSFYMTQIATVAAGHSISGNLYRIIKNNLCIEISSVIETQTGSGEGLINLQTQIQTDKTSLQSNLNQILSTFQFTQ